MNLHKNGNIERLACQRDSLNSLPPIEVPPFRILAFIGEWTERENQFGHDQVSAYIVEQGGEKKILLHRSWKPAPGYSAGGAEDSFVALPPEVKL